MLKRVKRKKDELRVECGRESDRECERRVNAVESSSCNLQSEEWRRLPSSRKHHRHGLINDQDRKRGDYNSTYFHSLRDTLVQFIQSLCNLWLLGGDYFFLPLSLSFSLPSFHPSAFTSTKGLMVCVFN